MVQCDWHYKGDSMDKKVLIALDNLGQFTLLGHWFIEARINSFCSEWMTERGQKGEMQCVCVKMSCQFDLIVKKEMNEYGEKKKVYCSM